MEAYNITLGGVSGFDPMITKECFSWCQENAEVHYHNSLIYMLLFFIVIAIANTIVYMIPLQYLDANKKSIILSALNLMLLIAPFVYILQIS